MMDVLYDLIRMSEADYFVGTLSSNIGRIVMQLFANKDTDPSKYVYSLDEIYVAYDILFALDHEFSISFLFSY